MIYFDNAATTYPKPDSVVSACVSGIQMYGGNPGRSGHEMSLKASEKIFKIRENISSFFNAPVEGVVFTMNCSMALNMAIKGVMLDGGHAIISHFEHNSVSRPVHALAKKGIITYTVAKGCGVTDFEREIRPDTKAIICTHASNVTGKILPVKELGMLCRKYNLIFIVDAAQTAGVLPIDIKEMGIDILCIAGHKGLYGPTGTGLMILNDTISGLHTIIEGGTGSVSIEINQPDFYPDKFESGTVNAVGILGLGAGLHHVEKIGIDAIYKKEFKFCEILRNELKSTENIKVYDDGFRMGEYVPIVLFNIDGMDSMDVVEELSKKGFGVRGGLHCAPLAHKYINTIQTGGVRFAPSFFNTTQQVKYFAHTVKQIAKKK